MNTKKFQGFTLIELMVAIAVSTIVVSVFFKMYETASHVERATFQRSSAYVIGDRIVNVIADSMRLISFNKVAFDPITDPSIVSNTASDGTITSLSFKSPYGTVISKLAEEASGTGSTCVLKLISEQMGSYNSMNRVYAHTKSGLREGTVSAISGNQVTVTFSELSDCGELPAGTLISGADMCYHLYVDTTANKEKINFFAVPMNTGDACSEEKTEPGVNDVIFYSYSQESNSTNTQMISIKKFVVEYLVEDRSDSSNIQRVWQLSANTGTNSNAAVNAIRFGIIVADPRPRYSNAEQITGDEIKYCIFPASTEKEYCYKNTNLNQSFFTFRRTVFIRNENYLQSNWGD